MSWPGRHKYLVLPLVLIAALFAQPVLGPGPEFTTYILMLAVFLVVFEMRWERQVALALGIPAIGANLAGQFCEALAGK